MRFFKTYWLALLSGILIGASYIPFPPWTLFICVAPLFIFWSKAPSAKTAFIGGWLAQFVFNLIGFHWVAGTAVEFLQIPKAGGVLALMAFAATANLYFPIAGVLTFYGAQWLRLKSWHLFLTSALFLAFLQSVSPSIFPWNFGYVWLWARYPAVQLTDIIGFDGLGILTILINGVLGCVLSQGLLPRELLNWRKKPVRIITGTFVFVIVLNLLGLEHAKKFQDFDSELNVLAVQANIGHFEKIKAIVGDAYRAPLIQQYLDLTEQGLVAHPETQLIVWPETALPLYLDSGSSISTRHAQTVKDFIASKSVPVVTGAFSKPAGSTTIFNSIYLFNRSGDVILPPYRKSVLFPFGEQAPFGDVFPFLNSVIPTQENYGKSTGPILIKVPLTDGETLRVGPQICYEGLYPWLSAELSGQGAQVFVNATNDSWFGNTFEPHQHLYMTLARALEFRRPLIRVTNTGITTTILANGRILEKSLMNEKSFIPFRVPYRKHPPTTFYERYGAMWPWVLLVALVISFLLGRRKSL